MIRLIAQRKNCINHPERVEKVIGTQLCASCYRNARKKLNSKKATCHPDKPHEAKGLCNTCYRTYRYSSLMRHEDYVRNKEREKSNSLRLRYGITLEEYNQMVLDQNGVCLICLQGPRQNRPLVVDHDHSCCPTDRTCGKCIRGLICDDCNWMIAFAKENPQTLLRAISYIKKEEL